MQTTAAQYKLIKKIRDERFDEESLHQYHLLIHIGTRDLQTAVIESSNNRLLWLEDFVLPSVSSNDELQEVLEQIFDSHAFLKAGFWKQIIVSVKNNKFVQVPRGLFAQEAEAEYIKFNAHVDADREHCLHIPNKRAGAVTVFAIYNELKSFLNSVYPNNPPVICHQSAALIEGVLQYAANRKEAEPPLYIYVDRFKLHIIYCRDGKLIYYNQFLIKQFSDYVKYIMLVMKSMNMDQYTSKVVLWGYIGNNSPHYHEFYKYINNVAFGERPDHLQFSFHFDEVQDHHFFDLFSINLLGKPAAP